MSGGSGNPIPGLAQMLSQANQPPPSQPEGTVNPLGMLQAYRANPFSLQTDVGRPAQFLPPALGNFDYGAQWRAQNAPPPSRPAAPIGGSGASALYGGFGGYGEGPGLGATDGQDGAAAAAADAATADANTAADGPAGGGAGSGGK